MSNEGRYLIGNLFAISNSQKIWRFVDVMVTLHVIQGVTPFKVTSAIISLMPKLPCINIYAVTVHWTTVYDIKCSTQICICVLYIVCVFISNIESNGWGITVEVCEKLLGDSFVHTREWNRCHFTSGQPERIHQLRA